MRDNRQDILDLFISGEKDVLPKHRPRPIFVLTPKRFANCNPALLGLLIVGGFNVSYSTVNLSNSTDEKMHQTAFRELINGVWR